MQKISLKLKKYWLIMLLVIIGFHLLILSRSVFFPYPELFIYSYLTKQGLIPYKQIFDQHFPGIMFFPVNLATLGIDTPQEAQMLHLGIVVLTQVILFVIGRKLFKSNLYALISNLLFFIWQPFFEGYVFWIDSFLPLLLLPAFYFLIVKTNSKSYFYSGLFLGIGLLFKQVVGPLIFLIILYLINSLRRGSIKLKGVINFISGLAIPVMILIFWVTKLGIWKDFLYWTITFNLTTFAEMGRKYPDLAGILKSMPIFGLSTFFLLYFWTKRKFKDIFILVIFFVGSLAFSYARFDFIHLQPALPFAILIITWAIRGIKMKKLVPFIGIYVLFSLYLLMPFYRIIIEDKIIFYGDFEKRVSVKVLNYADSGDSIFAFGTTFHLYQLTNTLPPGKVFVFQFPWFMKVTEERIFKGIISDPPKVIIRDNKAEVQDMKLVDYMPRINDYISRYYGVVEEVDGVEIMVPN